MIIPSLVNLTYSVDSVICKFSVLVWCLVDAKRKKTNSEIIFEIKTKYKP